MRPSGVPAITLWWPKRLQHSRLQTLLFHSCRLGTAPDGQCHIFVVPPTVGRHLAPGLGYLGVVEGATPFAWAALLDQAWLLVRLGYFHALGWLPQAYLTPLDQAQHPHARRLRVVVYRDAAGLPAWALDRRSLRARTATRRRCLRVALCVLLVCVTAWLPRGVPIPSTADVARWLSASLDWLATAQPFGTNRCG